MAKTKHLKYERVRRLPNVFIFEEGGQEVPLPWLPSDPGGREMILELGCGKGEHALALARDRPGCLVVGLDIKSHRLCSAGEAALARKADNLFFVRGEAEFLASWFAPGSLKEIWITFPDPHPKQREIKHRLTSPGFMALYAGLLKSGGRVHLKTDSSLFFEYSAGMVKDWGGTVEISTRDLYRGGGPVPGPAGVSSAFEKKARSRGKTIKYLVFTLT